MHYDDKEEDRGTRRSRKADFEARAGHSDKNERSSRGERSERGERSSRKAPRGRLNPKGNKPNVHAQTERSSSRKSGGAAAYKKGSKKAERF